MNNLINLAKQMGLIEMGYYNHLPNPTKCKTTHDVYNSHSQVNRSVKFQVNDIHGMLVLLGLGLIVALITWIVEMNLLVRILDK